MSFVSWFDHIWHDLFSTTYDAAATRATVVRDVTVALGLVQTALTAVESQGLIGQNDRANIDLGMEDAKKLVAAINAESSPSDIQNAIAMLQDVVGMLPASSAKTAATVTIGTAAALLPALVAAVTPAPTVAGAPAAA